jgi:hypothetical protein
MTQLPNFDGFTSCALFWLQFETVL